MEQSPTIAPKEGCILYSARAFAAASVPALGGGIPGELQGTFRWPKSVFCTGLLLLPMSGAIADSAKLFLRWQDETAYDVITDGQGGTLEMPGVLMHSLRGGRYMPVQRPIVVGDEWVFTVSNMKTSPILLAGLFFALTPWNGQTG